MSSFSRLEFDKFDNQGRVRVDTPPAVIPPVVVPAPVVNVTGGDLGSDAMPNVVRLRHHTISDLSEAIINFSLMGNNVIIPGISGQVIRVFKLFFICHEDNDLIIRDGVSTNLTGMLRFLKFGGLILNQDGDPWFTTSSGNAFIINAAKDKAVSGRIYYKQS